MKTHTNKPDNSVSPKPAQPTEKSRLLAMIFFETFQDCQVIRFKDGKTVIFNKHKTRGIH